MSECEGEKPRVIIGECERAGLPISAQIRSHDHHGVHELRWRRNGYTYVLEHYVVGPGWIEVPFIEAPPRAISGKKVANDRE